MSFYIVEQKEKQNKGGRMKKLWCRLFGHRWMPELNPIGNCYKEFTVYSADMICKTCGCNFSIIQNIKPN